ncbi:BTB/POZ domain-containing adapter for CUL3-mediated RhoA degradation protein 3 isoform X2 [Oncorhynchus mykiss]|nr:BTB/POZ domain-containing adapter for CUL3-mediated RhoA degradation protein 3 isoform X2 [Oncorhynchus mykiss]XP_036833320.1 BTB/POZ domain-containing adapter for CUL3-mediated RhoA degradation protein 3 isoform X2 [Oncorhynchus mykiss]
MSGISAVSSALPAATTRTTSFKGSCPSSKYVKLNVGGVLYYTTMQTLTKQDTMLKAMFSGRMEVLTDSEGWILIDRCGKHFGTILNYLRDGAVPLPEIRREVEELLAEAKYYLVQGLADECHAALENKDMYEPFCKVPLVTSSKEEQRLISTSKPTVKLLYNRSNNKYSYTSNSDDNMLKNIELFDKLSLRFNGRVLFIKDVIGDEICCWSFYGQGRKIAEVCCTSIVYATEKKQTKVCSFPQHDHRKGRWSSQRLVSMRRPLTSCFMSLRMGVVQTTLYWRLQEALQADPIISTRTRNGNASRGCAASTSNVPMTAPTTTSNYTSQPALSGSADLTSDHYLSLRSHYRYTHR